MYYLIPKNIIHQFEAIHNEPFEDFLLEYDDYFICQGDCGMFGFTSSVSTTIWDDTGTLLKGDNNEFYVNISELFSIHPEWRI